MTNSTVRRRTFLATAVGGLASTISYGRSQANETKNGRVSFGLIGAGWQPETKRRGRGLAIGKQATSHGDLAVICEVDQVAGDYARQLLSGGHCDLVSDYRSVVDRDDIDAVLIGTPDHWHVKIAIEALRSGKDVYCEKPVTVTIDEGKVLREIVKQTGRVFQVGTQQRSDYDSRFLTAVAMVRDGRIGEVGKIHVGLGPAKQGGPLQTAPVPETLDWDRWLGPAPMTEYIPERTHRTFRWWYEYAGGQMTDWGAHHVDIAQWAIDAHNSGPKSVKGTGKLNQPLEEGVPTRTDMFNTPFDFSVSCEFDGDIEMTIDTSRNGITFEGTKGRFFVNRGTLEGRPVVELKERPLPNHAIETLYGGSPPTTHMKNFFDCMASRRQPISDINTHHRTLTTCHLANICLRLGREVNWDPVSEQIVGDSVASRLMSRTYRDGYELGS